ncbi:hypothetical protein OGAPHI_007364 [Ogataea philodendri]|uniref:Uncharacterized protein n=1 Tax=Ogataea philodendri TaxID=1378263 RepID=A0A9P8NVF2_9ASCO|nr:uncharacterized protein OGAPHI_007364 [Ogataea philodendri]KAH3660159.1 hypothetical protein OGAPHI_007364 [Ogataea philodendri]
MWGWVEQLVVVLESLPAKIDQEVVLVWQRVGNSSNEWDLFQNLLAHVVHGGLNRGGLLQSKEFQSSFSGSFVRRIEESSSCLRNDIRQCTDFLRIPFPDRVDVCRQDSVGGRLQSGVVALVESVEHGSRGLQNSQILNSGFQNILPGTLVLERGSSELLTILQVRVVVQLAVNKVFGPSVLGDLDINTAHMRVLLDEVKPKVRNEGLDREHVELLGLDQNGVLDGVGRHDGGVVSLRVGNVKVAHKQNFDSGLHHLMDIRVRRVFFDLEKLDVVLSVGGCLQFNHLDSNN